MTSPLVARLEWRLAAVLLVMGREAEAFYYFNKVVDEMQPRLEHLLLQINETSADPGMIRRAPSSGGGGGGGRTKQDPRLPVIAS